MDGKQFMNSLPRTVKTRDMSMIKQFLDDVQVETKAAQVG